MTTYIAFLRGINVGAHNRMRMDELRGLFETLGYGATRTCGQSGNVVFEATVDDEAELRNDITDAIEGEFGYDVPVVVRTRAELEAIVEERPFDDHTDGGLKHYVAFLHEEPAHDRREALLAALNEAERFEVSGRGVNSELDKDKLGNGHFTDAENTLGVPATRRTLDVVTAVLERGG